MSATIELIDIRKHYGTGDKRVDALNGVSFTVSAGEFVAIQGPSGSGKSTLLSICGLLDSPSSGHYLFNQQEMSKASQSARCNKRRDDIGFIFQRHQLIPAMTVYENIAYPLFLAGGKSKEIKQRVETLLEQIGLGHRQKHQPKQLSGGERQRVGIARALIKQPKFIIADEPSASLDHKHAHESLLLMRELNTETGASFIIASHDPFVVEHCDRKIELEDGRLVEPHS